MKKPANGIQLDTLEDQMTRYAEIKAEIKEEYDAYEKRVKDLKEMKKSLESIIIEEVKKRKETVTVKNIRAEYIPNVIIKIKKEKQNGN